MSYNGIGLASVRGSGTSGYVQTNKFHLTASRQKPREQMRDLRSLEAPAARKANSDILEHNRKRAVEMKLLELREKLEEQGCVSPGLSRVGCEIRGFSLMAPVAEKDATAHRTVHNLCRFREGEIEEELAKQRGKFEKEAQLEAERERCVPDCSTDAVRDERPAS